MAFVVPALAAVGTMVGASAATAASTGAIVASTALSVGSTLVSGIAAFQQNRMQAKLAKQQAEIAQENAKRARFRSQVEQQDQDILARAVLGELASSQAASGLDFASGSFASRRKAAQILARKDSLNIRQGGELEAQNFEQQALDARFEAKQAKRAGTFSLLSTAFDTGSSLISGASKINKIKAAGIRRQAGLLT